MNPFEKQTTVRDVLASFLEPRQLDEAMLIWHSKYADKPTFALQGFVRECSTAFALETRRNDIFLNLVQSLSARVMHVKGNGGEQSSLDGSQREILGASSAVQMPAIDLSEAEPATAVHVFTLIIDHLCELSGEQAAGAIRGSLRKNISSFSLPTHSIAALENWLSGHFLEATKVEIPLATLQRLVNLAYVALCEHYGPVTSDTILDRAVRQVAQTSAGRAFHPQRLL